MALFFFALAEFRAIIGMHLMIEGAAALKIGIALAGGVARGLAHIGVLQVLEEHGIIPDMYAGTSAGSVVGAAAAAGLTGYELQQIAQETEWWFLAKRIPFGRWLLSSEGIETWLADIVGVATFEQLRKALAVVAVDFASGREVVFTSGPLLPVVRASCSIPGVYEPVHVADRLLVDGGLVRNLPVTPVRELGADFVIAVDLHSHVLDIALPENSIGGLLRASNILMRPQEEAEGAKADVVIRPHLAALGPLAFREVSAFVKAGRTAAIQAVPAILEHLAEMK